MSDPAPLKTPAGQRVLLHNQILQDHKASALGSVLEKVPSGRWRLGAKIKARPLFQPVGKINRSLIIDMAVVDPFDGLGISAQHALVDRPVCLRLLHEIARI